MNHHEQYSLKHHLGDKLEVKHSSALHAEAECTGPMGFFRVSDPELEWIGRPEPMGFFRVSDLVLVEQDAEV